MVSARGDPAFTTQAKIHIKHSIYAVLEAIHLDSRIFLGILQAGDGVISGSVALLIINYPAWFQCNDIDVYIPSTQLDFFVDALRSLMGMSVVSRLSDRVRPLSVTYVSDAISDVVSLLYGPDRILQLVVSKTDDSITPIFNFHSTAVMNFISSSAIFVAYPQLTFSFRSLVNWKVTTTHGRIRKRPFKALEKYSARGYEIDTDTENWADLSKHQCYTHPYCVLATRSISDSRCLWIDYDDGIYHLIKEDVSWTLRTDDVKCTGAYPASPTAVQ
ncbi:hypothetical protein H0H92_001702 [Tricholoma furcatifolium]|nr:hypothetical protein H0H92_001702 [Tricholoma furcatifolium]